MYVGKDLLNIYIRLERLCKKKSTREYWGTKVTKKNRTGRLIVMYERWIIFLDAFCIKGTFLNSTVCIDVIKVYFILITCILPFCECQYCICFDGGVILFATLVYKVGKKVPRMRTMLFRRSFRIIRKSFFGNY